MKHLSSSKIPKKISDEDRNKKKKIKSKSAKRRRILRDSISSYSSSYSDSEEISRSQGKSSKSKKLVDKRKRGSKKSEKKSLRRKKRSRKDSRVSDSRSGCSTFSDSEWSRSPVRRSKVRKRESARGRKSSHRYESSRGRIRNRSPSCSTCNGGSRSRGSSGGRGQSRSPSDERFESRRKRSAPVEGRVDSSREQSLVEERLGSSRGRSPIDLRFERSGQRPVSDRFESRRGQSPIDEDRFESSRGWSPIEDIFGSSHMRSPIEDRFGSRPMRSPTDERFGNSQGRSPIDERFGSSHGHNPIDDRFESGHGRSPIDDRFESSHGQRPIEERFESHGQSPIDGRFESSCGRSPIEDIDWEQGGSKRLRSALAVTKSADEDGNVIKAYDDYPSSRSNEFYGQGNNKRDFNVEDKEKDPYDEGFRVEVVASNDRREDEGKEAADLELILRQKALENFKKFRCSRPAEFETLNDKKDELSEPESYQRSKTFAKTSDYKPHSSVDDQRHVQGETNSNKLKGRFVPNISTDKVDENSVLILSNAQNTSSRLKRVQESSNKISFEQTSLANDNQNKRVVAQASSVKVIGTGVDTADCPASRSCNTENQNRKSDEPMVESASGSQFEQKTFSRMRDGEMVQVSYKVYIPKKPPALARRQLQR